MAFNKNTIVIAEVNSSGLAFIEGATEAIAVPPQTAVPYASKKESFSDTPSSFPIKITAPKDKRTKAEIHKK